VIVSTKRQSTVAFFLEQYLFLLPLFRPRRAGLRDFICTPRWAITTSSKAAARQPCPRWLVKANKMHRRHRMNFTLPGTTRSPRPPELPDCGGSPCAFWDWPGPRRQARWAGIGLRGQLHAAVHPTDCLGVHFAVGLDLDVPRSEIVFGVFE
jgi:hypothetical protein